jgi:hypothetical protein
LEWWPLVRRLLAAVIIQAPLIQLKGLVFRTPQFSDTTLEFVAQNGQVTGLKRKDPEGEFTLPKK